MENKTESSQKLSQTTSPIQPNPPLQTPSEHKWHSFLTSKLFLITVVIVVLFTIIYAGIYLNLNSQLDKITHSNPTPTVISQPSPSQDETVTWKTYKSDKYSFELTYPSNWYLFIHEDSKNFPFYVSLKPDANSRSGILIQPVNSKDQSVFSSSAWKTKTHQITFSQRIAKDFSGDYGNLYVRQIRIEDLDRLLWNQFNEISYEIEGSDLNNLPAFDQILSTFKFLPTSSTGGDQGNQVVCTADAKLCPDGTYVSRQSPTCEFAACPQK